MVALKKKVVVSIPKVSAATVATKKRSGGVQPKRKQTDKRKKLVKLVLENIGKTKPLTGQEMMLEAGYAETTARAAHTDILTKAKNEPEVIEYVQRLKNLRSRVVGVMEKKIGGTSVGNATFALATLDKSIAMAEGKPTERREIILDPEDRARIDAILSENE